MKRINWPVLLAALSPFALWLLAYYAVVGLLVGLGVIRG